MGMYKYVRDLWKRPKENLGDLWQQRLVQWRKEGASVRVVKPTRIDRARSLGYKAKPGYLVVRTRVTAGGHKRPMIRHGRRPKRFHQILQLTKGHQQIAEERTAKKYPNCEVLNSYLVGEDGKHQWFEVIVVDKNHPVIKSDKNIKWIAEKKHTGRVFRGKTSAGRKSRGLRKKGKGAEKIRPGLRSHKRRGN